MTIVQGEEHRHDRPSHPLEGTSSGRWFVPVFLILLLVGLGYVAYALGRDLTSAVAVPWILLGIALLIALGFEFVNGFHDTANAVATVIYTRSMPAELAVIWSGFFNFLGVLMSSGAVAFGILALLPVELILQVGSGSGLAMVFALLLAAIVWNLGTWYLGLPSSSSHTLVGSITMAANGSGLQWSTVRNMMMAWILTLPASIMIAFLLFVVLRQLV